MPRVRLLLLLTVGLCGAGLWASVPDAGRPADALREAQAASVELDGLGEQIAARVRLNELLTDELEAGRPLPEVAALMWETNAVEPYYRLALEALPVGPTDEARAAQHLIRRLDARLEDGPADRRAAVLARLWAEYQAAYGDSGRPAAHGSSGLPDRGTRGNVEGG